MHEEQDIDEEQKENIRSYAELLIMKYIERESPCELNLSQECRENVLSRYEMEKDMPTRNLFDRVVSHVHNQIHMLHGQQFIRSDNFEQFLTKVVLRRAQIDTFRSGANSAKTVEEAQPQSKTFQKLDSIRRRLSGVGAFKGNHQQTTSQSPLREDLFDMRDVVKGLFGEVAKKDAIIEDLRAQLERERAINEMHAKKSLNNTKRTK